MSITALAAIIGVVATLIGALAGAFVQSRRLPSDIRLADAQAEKVQHEAGQLVIKSLSDEVERQKRKLGEFEERLTKAESRATNAESRLADAEARTQEFRRAVIVIGEGRRQDRIKARKMAVTLVGVIDHLLDCVEHPEKGNEVDRAAIARLVQSMLDNYSEESFISTTEA